MFIQTSSRVAPVCTAVVLFATAAATSRAAAAEQACSFEITPYLWAIGLDGDVTVRGQKVSVDKSFDEVLDSVDIAGAVLMVGQLRRFVALAQLDYYSLSSDELDNPPARGSLDSDVVLATLAAGYQFGKPQAGHTLAVLLGLRHLSLDNELSLDGIGRFEHDDDVTDPVLMLRPSWRISDRWRFNPTLAYSTGGDSESSYELQPQLQFQMSERVALRFGYRRLDYEIEGPRGNRWDGAFQGLFVGVGGTFAAD
jgi:hypothetical protein